MADDFCSRPIPKDIGFEVPFTELDGAIVYLHTICLHRAGHVQLINMKMLMGSFGFIYTTVYD